jgi:hypothetical protein
MEKDKERHMHTYIHACSTSSGKSQEECIAQRSKKTANKNSHLFARNSEAKEIKFGIDAFGSEEYCCSCLLLPIGETKRLAKKKKH